MVLSRAPDMCVTLTGPIQLFTKYSVIPICVR